MSTALPDSSTPAIRGGTPMFPDRLPLARPPVGRPAAVASSVAPILESGMLTNGRYVRELESRAAEYLGVRDCVAVSSCTAGLMLVIRALGLSGEVIVPSFTFAATAHAVSWNGLRPRFTDIDPETLTLSPAEAFRMVGVRTSAILATHIFGTPCYIEALAAVASRVGIALLFDAAHAFGSLHNGMHVGGFGDAEVFSLSPTKVMTSVEGGIVATNNDLLAERLRVGRDYGNPGDYDCRFVGLNARMSELHAAVALESMEDLEPRIAERNRIAEKYRTALEPIPGLSLPEVPETDRSTYKDFTVLIDRDEFGIESREVADALAVEGIETRRYYSPPVHAMKSYRALTGLNGRLDVTERVSNQVLTLPLWSGMTDEQISGVVRAIARIQKHFRSRSHQMKGELVEIDE
jgi:dTDP-4-amino-4,6-dideoxygalactose transaminase